MGTHWWGHQAAASKLKRSVRVLGTPMLPSALTASATWRQGRDGAARLNKTLAHTETFIIIFFFFFISVPSVFYMKTRVCVRARMCMCVCIPSISLSIASLYGEDLSA